MLREKDFEGARQNYEEYLTHHAGSAFVLTNLGIALQELGRVAEANQRFREALAIDPHESEALRRLNPTRVR